jgi:anti-anti-sigma factor
VEVAISDFGDLGKRVMLEGRLDILGAAKIVEPLANIADSYSLIVDMSGVDFIGSTGMHHLLLVAKTVSSNYRTLVLLNTRPLVEDVLTKAGLQAILPIVHGEQEAWAALTGMVDRSD